MPRFKDMYKGVSRAILSYEYHIARKEDNKGIFIHLLDSLFNIAILDYINIKELVYPDKLYSYEFNGVIFYYDPGVGITVRLYNDFRWNYSVPLYSWADLGRVILTQMDDEELEDAEKHHAS